MLVIVAAVIDLLSRRHPRIVFEVSSSDTTSLLRRLRDREVDLIISRMAETAVLNANYLLHRIKDHYEVPYPERPMHECVVSDKQQVEHGVKALDIAKRLIDYGYHPPTIYFPLIVKGALMLEPTESESKERIDHLAEALIQIAQEAEKEPETVLGAPTKTVVSRLNETKAAREPNYRWKGR